jgi:hypothetical protein
MTERRRSRRFPVSPGRDRAILRRGTARHAATIVDISAEGFRIRTDCDCRPAVDATATLETCDGRHVVRVANVRHDETHSIIGLERLRDLPAAGRDNRPGLTVHWALLGGAVAIGATIAAIPASRLALLDLARQVLHRVMGG